MGDRLHLVSKFLPVVLYFGIGVILSLLIYFFGSRWLGGLEEQLEAYADTTRFDQKPVFINTLDLSDDDASLRPCVLYLTSDSLYVAFEGNGRVDVFDKSFDKSRTVVLSHGQPAAITGLAVDAQRIYVADNMSGEIRFHNMNGTVLSAFSWLPGKAGRLHPFGLNLFKGNIYVTDTVQNQVFIISVSNSPSVTEEGELLFAIPGPGGDTTLFREPVTTAITPDGRILVSDVGRHSIMAFTCNGRFAYNFASYAEQQIRKPYSIAFDNIPNPALVEKESKVFDPSGILHQGRIHVVDTESGEILVYDAIGKYILSYGSDQLKQPRSIAIDHSRRVILIADAGRRGIIIYKY